MPAWAGRSATATGLGASASATTASSWSVRTSAAAGQSQRRGRNRSGYCGARAAIWAVLQIYVRIEADRQARVEIGLELALVLRQLHPRQRRPRRPLAHGAVTSLARLPMPITMSRPLFSRSVIAPVLKSIDSWPGSVNRSGASRSGTARHAPSRRASCASPRCTRGRARASTLADIPSRPSRHTRPAPRVDVDVGAEHDRLGEHVLRRSQRAVHVRRRERCTIGRDVARESRRRCDRRRRRRRDRASRSAGDRRRRANNAKWPSPSVRRRADVDSFVVAAREQDRRPHLRGPCRASRTRCRRRAPGDRSSPMRRDRCRDAPCRSPR